MSDPRSPRPSGRLQGELGSVAASSTMTTLEALAARLHALEAIDTTPFQRRARVLQSLWREEQGFPYGQHTARGRSRPLGSRLPMPWARDQLPNFVFDRYCDFAKLDRLLLPVGPA